MNKRAYMLIAALALAVLAGCSAPGEFLDPNAGQRLEVDPFADGYNAETDELELPEYKDRVINGDQGQ